MNKSLKILIVLFLTFVLVAVGGYFYYQNKLSPVNSEEEVKKVEFLVEPGSVPASIAKNLKENKLIKDEKSFLAYIKINKFGSELKAGNYLLTDKMSVQEITDIIIKGVSIQKRFTIPEGYTIWQICELLVNKNKTLLLSKILLSYQPTSLFSVVTT